MSNAPKPPTPLIGSGNIRKTVSSINWFLWKNMQDVELWQALTPQDVCRALLVLELPPQVKVLRLSRLPDKGDIVDWIKS